MWEPRRLTNLWDPAACYRNSFIFFYNEMQCNLLVSVLYSYASCYPIKYKRSRIIIITTERNCATNISNSSSFFGKNLFVVLSPGFLLERRLGGTT
jgi:hypothetical protein